MPSECIHTDGYYKMNNANSRGWVRAGWGVELGDWGRD